MTIDEISRTLPNGFHDSYLIGVHIDFERASASMDFAVDVSDVESESEIVSRRGRLALSGLVYFVVAPPDQPLAYDQQMQWISADSSDFTELKHSPRLPKIPDGSFAHWFYSSTDNNFLYIAAANAEFDWTE